VNSAFAHDHGKARISSSTNPLDNLNEQIQIRQKLHPALPRQIAESLHTRRVGEQHAIPRQELNVSDDREPGAQPPQHRRILATQR